MVKMVYTKGHFAPITFCDICNKRIYEAGKAGVIYPLEADEGDDIPVFIVHKGDCLHQAEDRLGGRSESGFDELSVNLYYLLFNVGLTIEKLERAKSTAEMLSSI